MNVDAVVQCRLRVQQLEERVLTPEIPHLKGSRRSPTMYAQYQACPFTSHGFVDLSAFD